MSILITGAGGMVGSHMIDYLRDKGFTHSKIIGTYYKPTIDLKRLIFPKIFY